MTIYKRTERMIITSNMHVTKEDIKDGNFKMSDVIKHLIDNEHNIVQMTPKYMELMDVCIPTLTPQSDDTIDYSDCIAITHPSMRPKTFFYETCRIIRIDLTEQPRGVLCTTGRMHKDIIEIGYDMVPKKWAHSVLVIKIERMTDAGCFATWSIVS